MTARDLQDKDKQFTRAKSFDTFAAIGPCLVRRPGSAGPVHQDLSQRQAPPVLRTPANLIFSVPFLLRFISQASDPAPRRRGHDRHAGRDRPDAPGRPGGRGNRGHRDAFQPGAESHRDPPGDPHEVLSSTPPTRTRSAKSPAGACWTA
ncbi:MAG: fumarylacetoacetate hydrolase family protein [Chromatiales bacterium]|nr:fumarylacetoacetate hydrolase family protein [Chromatiales bacterium]